MTDPHNDTQKPMTPERLATIRFGRRFDWVIALVIMVIAIGFIAMLQSLPQRATFFPWFITISIMLIGGIYCAGKIRRPDRWDGLYDPEADLDAGDVDTGPVFLFEHRRGILRFIAIFVGLILATMALGPEIAVPAFLAVMLWAGGESRIVAILSGVAFWLAIHFVFGDFMSINLPPGYLTETFLK